MIAPPLFSLEHPVGAVKKRGESPLERVRGDEDATAFGDGVGLTVDASEGRKRGRFCPYLFDFLRHTSRADYGVCDIDPNVSRPGMPSLLVYTRTGRVLGDFVYTFHRDLDRENCLIRQRNRWNLRGRGTQDLRT